MDVDAVSKGTGMAANRVCHTCGEPGHFDDRLLQGQENWRQRKGQELEAKERAGKARRKATKAKDLEVPGVYLGLRNIGDSTTTRTFNYAQN